MPELYIAPSYGLLSNRSCSPEALALKGLPVLMACIDRARHTSSS